MYSGIVLIRFDLYRQKYADNCGITDSFFIRKVYDAFLTSPTCSHRNLMTHRQTFTLAETE